MNIIQQDTYLLHQSWCQRTTVRAMGFKGKPVTLEIEVKRNAYDDQSHGVVRALDDLEWKTLIFVPLCELPAETLAVRYTRKDKEDALRGLSLATAELYRRAKELLRLREPKA